MNVISILENLLGLSRENSSVGSFLQLKGQVRFQHETEDDQSRWPQCSHWIVGRELLLYHHLDLSEVPKKQRSKVIAQKIGQLSPFEQTEHYILDEEGQVMLWLWDKALRESALQNALENYSALEKHILDLAVVPEPILRQRSRHGLVKLGCFTGADRQEWQDNILVASFFSATPNDVQESAMNEAWGSPAGTLSFSSEPLLWRTGLLALALVIVYQLGVSVGYQIHKRSLANQLDETRQAVAVVAQVRGEVRRMKNQNTRILDGTGRLDQLDVLAEFDSLIPESASIKDWRYQNQVLNVQLEDQELDNRVYLEKLASSSLFANVQISPGTDAQSALISLKVMPR